MEVHRSYKQLIFNYGESFIDKLKMVARKRLSSKRGYIWYTTKNQSSYTQIHVQGRYDKRCKRKYTLKLLDKRA